MNKIKNNINILNFTILILLYVEITVAGSSV